MITAEFAERRKYPRLKARWPVTLITRDGHVQGETKNIGIGGGLISCDHPLSLHEKICIILKVPNHEPVALNTIVARSNVSHKYKRKTSPDVALYYVDLTEQQQQLLSTELSNSKGDALPEEEKRCPGCQEEVRAFKTCRECGVVTCTGCLRLLTDESLQEPSPSCPQCDGVLA